MEDPTCVEPDCERAVYVKARGLCRQHYRRWWRAQQARACTIEGCGRPHDALGYCAMHRRRFRLYSDPLATAPKPERACRVAACEVPHYGAGLCEPHYARMRRHGSTDDQRAVRIPLADRFWPRVDKNGPIPDARPDLGPCWLWTGPPNGAGYGTVGVGGSAGPIGAHVAAVLLDGREVPAGHEPDHLCRVKMCVRPDHLEVVTAAENKRRARTSPPTRHQRDRG